jgi:L-fucose isomerase-like protein
MLHVLCSQLHTEVSDLPFKVSDSFIAENQVVAILSGGTEALFVDLVKTKKIDLKRPVYLMVSEYSNSLPAALEVLSFIRQRKGIAKIMQHPKDTIFPEVSETESLTRVPLEKVLHNDKKLRLGVVGRPSDWLIASQVDRKDVLEKMNCELVEIPFEELSSLGEVDPGMKGAEAIYERLKEIVAKHKLDGVTLRCFDLFTACKNTGCIAVSKLNDEGIPAGCEGDIPVLLTMMACKKLTGEPGFMGSPARIKSDGKILLAKCTIALKMTEKHEYTTHFESGIGVAIHGEVAPGEYTLVKLSNDMKRLLAVNVTVTGCQFEQNLCRTQIWIQSTPIVSQYLLTSPLSDHHVLIKGHHAAKFWRA